MNEQTSQNASDRDMSTKDSDKQKDMSGTMGDTKKDMESPGAFQRNDPGRSTGEAGRT